MNWAEFIAGAALGTTVGIAFWVGFFVRRWIDKQ